MPVSQQLKIEAISLLKNLIETPSFSGSETATANILQAFLHQNQVILNRTGNNVWAKAQGWQPGKPILLLCSHHDTVRPVAGWQRNPFDPAIENGKLYGLGSNDAGASLVALAAVFLHYYRAENLPWNLLFLAAAEEETSGKYGVSMVLPELGEIAAGIVGEPTGMQMAIAQKGLMVLDAEAIGKAGHAAREEGENAIYIALKDVEFLRNYQFKKVSDLLGPVKMTVTQIEAGTQHNVIPATCKFVIDIRSNEYYSNHEIFEVLQQNLQSKIQARSFRLNSSAITVEHPLVQKGKAIGLTCFGSPTLSDAALMPFPVLKIGPGQSARSHTADEFILLREIETGIDIYSELINST